MPPDDRFRPRPGDPRFQPAVAVIVAMAPASLSGAALSLTVSAPALGTIIVSMGSVTLLGSPRPSSVVAGSIASLLDSITLTSSARPLTVEAIAPGTIIISMRPVTISSGAAAVVVAPGAISIAFDVIALASSVRNVAIAAITRILMDAALATVQVRTVSIAAGGTSVLVDAIALHASACAIRSIGGAITISEWRAVMVPAENRLVCIPED